MTSSSCHEPVLNGKLVWIKWLTIAFFVVSVFVSYNFWHIVSMQKVNTTKIDVNASDIDENRQMLEEIRDWRDELKRRNPNLDVPPTPCDCHHNEG